MKKGSPCQRGLLGPRPLLCTLCGVALPQASRLPHAPGRAWPPAERSISPVATFPPWKHSGLGSASAGSCQVGDHFKLDDSRVWMRLHFWACREAEGPKNSSFCPKEFMKAQVGLFGPSGGERTKLQVEFESLGTTFSEDAK